MRENRYFTQRAFDYVETNNKSIFDNERYIRNIKMPFKIIIGNADFVKGSYNNTEIDFITNANRLTGVNTIIFNE